MTTVALFMISPNWSETTVNVPLEVLENAAVIPQGLNLNPPKEIENKPKPIEPEVVKKVFGVSRKSHTANASSESSASVKQGNTVAKEMDDLKLDQNDPDQIPIPAADYLITTPVKLISQVQANRTEEARKAGYTGTSQMILIIGADGLVKKVDLLNSLEFGLNEKALEIARSLKFTPAKMQDQAVATKIRFSINFKSIN